MNYIVVRQPPSVGGNVCHFYAGGDRSLADQVVSAWVRTKNEVWEVTAENLARLTPLSRAFVEESVASGTKGVFR